MKKRFLIPIFCLLSVTMVAQEKSVISDLDELRLDIGQTYKPTTYSVDNQGNKITASVSGNQIMINSKSQEPLDIKIVAYNDAGGNNTKPRFLREQKIIPPKTECSNRFKF